MKKIGIAAVTYKDNFGSALQTYATQYILEKLGYDARIFEIKGVHRSIFTKKLLYYAGRIFDPVEAKYLFANLTSRSRKKASVVSDGFAQEMKVRHKMYADFNKKWNKMLPTVKGRNGLRKQASEMDAVVVGSDQLWRPSNIVGSYYTLEFVPDEVKKIAFSTSFGVPELPSQLHKHAKKFLSRIEHISVREDSGAEIVRKESGRDATVVCDPTMMLTAEEWMHIQDEKPFAEGNYILMYLMGDNPEQREFVKALSMAIVRHHGDGMAQPRHVEGLAGGGEHHRELLAGIGAEGGHMLPRQLQVVMDLVGDHVDPVLFADGQMAASSLQTTGYIRY